MRVSVVIPVYNGAATLVDCLHALTKQSLAKKHYEIIVVDDGSTDETAMIAAQFGVRLLLQFNSGAPAARNTGLYAARGKWVAFTDADTIPSRNWLARLLRGVEDADGNVVAFGAAGPIRGHESETPAARFVDLMGGLDAERHLSHPRFPFAPTGNAMYLRELLLDAGGFDERFATYDACDLHLRLRQLTKLPYHYEPSALVLHRHRATWREYWKQQRGYGVGYAQFLIRHRKLCYWGIADELRALAAIARNFGMMLMPARGDEAIVRRGSFVRSAAQHVGFLQTFYNERERQRWDRPRRAHRKVPAVARRALRVACSPGDVVAAIAIAWFVLRLPSVLARYDLKGFLRKLDKTRGFRTSFERIVRVRSAVLRLFRRFDTCYARAFTLYRFLDVDPERIDLRLGIEPARQPGERIRGHAWVLLDGDILEGPEATAIARSREVIVPTLQAS